MSDLIKNYRNDDFSGIIHISPVIMASNRFKLFLVACLCRNISTFIGQTFNSVFTIFISEYDFSVGSYIFNRLIGKIDYFFALIVNNCLPRISWPQSYGLGSENQTKSNNIPRYWETAADGEKVWNYVQQQEGNVKPLSQNMFSYGASGVIGGVKTLYNYLTLHPKSYTDKYKHAVINCSASQSGEGGYDLANAFSNFKEDRDISSGGNTLDSSQADQYANKIGRLLGTKYPNGECDEIVQRYINKRW